MGQLPIGGIGGGCYAPAGRPAYAGSPKVAAFSSDAMRADQASSWYRRMSAVYALGAWTILGSLIFLGRKKSKPLGTVLRQDLPPDRSLPWGVLGGHRSGFTVPPVPNTLQNLGTGDGCLEPFVVRISARNCIFKSSYLSLVYLFIYFERGRPLYLKNLCNVSVGIFRY